MSHLQLGEYSLLGLSDGLSEGDSPVLAETPPALDPSLFLVASNPWGATDDTTYGSLDTTTRPGDFIGAALEDIVNYCDLDLPSPDPFAASSSDPSVYMDLGSFDYEQGLEDPAMSSYNHAPLATGPCTASFSSTNSVLAS